MLGGTFCFLLSCDKPARRILKPAVNRLLNRRFFLGGLYRLLSNFLDSIIDDRLLERRFVGFVRGGSLFRFDAFCSSSRIDQIGSDRAVYATLYRLASERGDGGLCGKQTFLVVEWLHLGRRETLGFVMNLGSFRNQAARYGSCLAMDGNPLGFFGQVRFAYASPADATCNLHHGGYARGIVVGALVIGGNLHEHSLHDGKKHNEKSQYGDDVENDNSSTADSANENPDEQQNRCNYRTSRANKASRQPKRLDPLHERRCDLAGIVMGDEHDLARTCTLLGRAAFRIGLILGNNILAGTAGKSACDERTVERLEHVNCCRNRCKHESRHGQCRNDHGQNANHYDHGAAYCLNKGEVRRTCKLFYLCMEIGFFLKLVRDVEGGVLFFFGPRGTRAYLFRQVLNMLKWFCHRWAFQLQFPFCT